MTTAQVVPFFNARPFVPFTFTLVDGREIHVMRPEQVSIGRYALIVAFRHPTRQLEVFDIDHIVSLRTVFAADPNFWNG
jgi:hypothetical protein